MIKNQALFLISKSLKGHSKIPKLEGPKGTLLHKLKHAYNTTDWNIILSLVPNFSHFFRPIFLSKSRTHTLSLKSCIHPDNSLQDKWHSSRVWAVGLIRVNRNMINYYLTFIWLVISTSFCFSITFRSTWYLLSCKLYLQCRKNI